MKSTITATQTLEQYVKHWLETSASSQSPKTVSDHYKDFCDLYKNNLIVVGLATQKLFARIVYKIPGVVKLTKGKIDMFYFQQKGDE